LTQGKSCEIPYCTLWLQPFPYSKRFSFPVFTPIILADISSAISAYSRMRFTFDRGVLYVCFIFDYIHQGQVVLSLLTIANPTSAIFNAGASFVPSPVTATISRFLLSLLSMIPFTNMYLSSGDERAKTLSLGQISSSFA
jgi:hypothetical protein